MKTSGILVLLLIAMVGFGVGNNILAAENARKVVTYRALPTTRKTMDRDLTFCLTFDGKSVGADFAKGDPDCKTFGEGNLEFRIVPGFDGQNAFDRDPGERLHYDVRGNIDHREGTMIFWIMARDYDPCRVSTKDPVKTHKPYVHVRFVQGRAWINLFAYQYYSSPKALFYWHNSFAEKSNYKLAGVPLTGVVAGQWLQLAFTWDSQRIRAYLNGRLRSTTPLPAAVLKTLDMKPDPKKSFIGVRQMMWSDAKETGRTAIDDFKIYSRALTPVEIRRQYLALVDSVESVHMPAIDLEINGVDTGKGDLDRIAVSLDCSPLPDNWLAALRRGKLRFAYKLEGPDKTVREGEWKIASVKTVRVLDRVTAPGKYKFALSLSWMGSEVRKVEKEFQRPATDWAGNLLGLGDDVPSPWTPMSMDENNVVRVWAREYHFGDGPLPERVLHQGRELLARPPRLMIDTAAGPAPIRFTCTGRKATPKLVVLTGQGRAGGFSLTWTTRIEFDGMIRFDFRIHGAPKIRSMRLAWDVAPQFSRYLLAPLLKQAGNGRHAFPLQLQDRRSVYQLWLTSERKGFCWSLEHDANWIYKPGEKILRVTQDAAGGHCEVRMVNREVVIPEGAEYHALFIATPSRPLPRVCRTFRLGSGGSVRYRNMDVCMIATAGAGLESVFTFKPDWDFGREMDRLARRGWVRKPLSRMDKLMVYGGATALNDHALEGRYFGKYWDLPGGSIVPFHDRRKHHEIRCLQTNTCPHTRYSDYILANIKLLFDHPKQRIFGIYYDLAGNTACVNPLHGCRFKDAFGRVVSRMILLGLRRHLMRTMAYCHERGRVTMYHAHSYYSPFCHSFGDYWYPGEQYCSLMQRRKSPYVYSDVIPDAVYRSELNMRLRGSGILFLPNLKRANRNYGSTEQTQAMMTRLLLHDVPVSMAFCDGAVIDRWWGIAVRYKLDDARVHFYYEQGQITSSNPGVKITWYECADGRVLAIVGNVTRKAQEVTVDFAKLMHAPGKFSLEYITGSGPMRMGDKDLIITIPPRLFWVVGVRRCGMRNDE